MAKNKKSKTKEEVVASLSRSSELEMWNHLAPKQYDADIKEKTKRNPQHKLFTESTKAMKSLGVQEKSLPTHYERFDSGRMNVGLKTKYMGLPKLLKLKEDKAVGEGTVLKPKPKKKK